MIQQRAKQRLAQARPRPPKALAGLFQLGFFLAFFVFAPRHKVLLRLKPLPRLV